jgi:hypothetical protein
METRFWTQQEDDKLRNLSSEYMTYNDMAMDIGRSMDAVKGRVKKLGIVHPLYCKRLDVPELRPFKTKREECYTSYGQRKSLLELGRGECRWPLFDDSGFCGAKCTGVYCEVHRKVSGG